MRKGFAMERPHIWLRAENRPDEARVGLTETGAKALIEAGFKVTVEHSPHRILKMDGYRHAGVEVAAEHSWPNAPKATIIFGLKELPDDGTALGHRHIMFGHAFKQQIAGKKLLQRFKAGGGTLLDLEYLVDDHARRVAAFGYWAGFAGAAVTLKAWCAQQNGGICGPVSAFANQDEMRANLLQTLSATQQTPPSAIIIGALGRVGRGVGDFCDAMNMPTTKWDIAETAHGGPYPEICTHAILFNCILAHEGTPQFVPSSVLTQQRALGVIGDIACDPDSKYNPISIYDHVTDWQRPVVRVHREPRLDVMAIDNLPALLPKESSQDFAAQLLPHLLKLGDPTAAIWQRATATFRQHLCEI